MEIWEKVKGVANDAANALSDAAKDVSNNVKELSDKNKLKRAIREEELRLNGYYKSIGEKFYHEYPAAPEGYYEEYDGIEKSKSEIEKLKNELSALENASKCPKCGVKVTTEQLYCKNCGFKLK